MTQEKYRALFLEEAREYVDRIFSLLEDDSTDGGAPATEELFRHFHSIKGMASLVKLPRIAEQAKAAEDLLARIRSGAAPFTAEPLLPFALQISALLAEFAAGSGPAAAGAHGGGAAPGTDARKEPRKAEAPSAAASPGVRVDLLPRTARVPLARLDELVDCMSVMMVQGEWLAERASRKRDHELASGAERLLLTLRLLRSCVLSVRMIPFSTVCLALQRLCHEASGRVGKPVTLDIRGDAVTLDRAVLEALIDPLNHLLRNCVDHGIEDPAVRRARNKPEAGRILLSLSRDGNAVCITLEDDGEGIDCAAIKSRAVELGFVSPDRAALLSNEEALGLVMLPGFSRKKEVTDLSGRGVGLDVVKRKIEALGGAVSITSRPGIDTTVALRVPFTVVVIEALIVACAGQVFAVPSRKIMTTAEVLPGNIVRPRGHGASAALQDLVVFKMADLLGIRGESDEIEPLRHIIVVDARGRTIGLLVDRVLDFREILVKPLGPPFDGVPGYSGATILADGRPALILEPETILSAWEEAAC